jgi:hypothetical protein
VIIGFHHAIQAWKPDDVPMQEKLAELMMKSCREVMPGTPIFQFTNQYTNAVHGVDKVIRHEWKRGQDWIPFYTSFMEETEGELLILDTDVIVMKDLRRLRELDADLVIPVRKKPIEADDGTKMWVLMGVCYSRSPEVWKEITRRVRAMPREADRNWWGVQLVLWDMFQESLKGESPFKIRAVKQWEFNYTPKDDLDPGQGVWAMHYKGEHRKLWMLRKWGAVSEQL